MIQGHHILHALHAAELLPHPIVNSARADADNPRVFLESDWYEHAIVRTGPCYSVTDNRGELVFGLVGVSLEVAFRGAVELLRAARAHAALRITVADRARELSSIGIGTSARGDDQLLIRDLERPGYVSVATRVADSPWLWEVVSGSASSDRYLSPARMEWPELRMLAADCAL